jgi:OOP family OmpA-OmpF porin
MKFLIKHTIFVLLLTGLVNSSFSQRSMNYDSTNRYNKNYDSANRYNKRSFRTWSIGLNGGVLSTYTPFNGNLNGDYQKVQYDWGYGGYIKKQILPNFGIEADFLAGEVKGEHSNALPYHSAAQDSSSFKSHIDWSGSINANFAIANFGLNHKRSFLTPYITAGAGYMSSNAQVYFTPAGANTNFNQNWFIPIGAGFKLNVAKALNIDFGYNVYFMKTDNFDGVASGVNDRFSYAHAGIEIALGKHGSSQLQNFSPAAAMREANEAQRAEFNNKILMMEQQRMADAQQRMADSTQMARDMADDDGDGVANKFDKCPATPANTVVDGSGCPLKVPEPVVIAPQVTEKIVVTDEDRNVLKEAIKNLEFDLGKSTLKPTSYDALNKVAQLLIQKNFSLTLAGHTDNIGSESSNMKLSKDRAEAVKSYLVGQGANPSRIEATGYGSTQPIATNKTPEGRQQNRRVEFTIF